MFVSFGLFIGCSQAKTLYETKSVIATISYGYIGYTSTGRLYLGLVDSDGREALDFIEAVRSDELQLGEGRYIESYNAVTCEPWDILQVSGLQVEIDKSYTNSYTRENTDTENSVFFSSTTTTVTEWNLSIHPGQEQYIPVYGISDAVDVPLSIDSALIRMNDSPYLPMSELFIGFDEPVIEDHNLGSLCQGFYSAVRLSGVSIEVENAREHTPYAALAQLPNLQSIPDNPQISVVNGSELGKKFIVSHDPFHSRITSYVLSQPSMVEIPLFRPAGTFSVTLTTDNNNADILQIFIPELYQFHQQMTHWGSIVYEPFYEVSLSDNSLAFDILAVSNDIPQSMDVILRLVDKYENFLSYIDLNGNPLSENMNMVSVSSGEAYVIPIDDFY